MSGKISKASEAHTKRAASAASKVLRNPRATKSAKSVAGSALTQRSQVKKGGTAYIVRGIEAESTVVTSSTSVRTINEGASKYGKALSRLANK
jgi:hypothetical protein